MWRQPTYANKRLAVSASSKALGFVVPLKTPARLKPAMLARA